MSTPTSPSPCRADIQWYRVWTGVSRRPVGQAHCGAFWYADSCTLDTSDQPVPTLTHRSPTDHRIFEQSTTNIWTSLATSCRQILKVSGVDPAKVKGIGFDATCSLAVVDKAGRPVSVSRSSAVAGDDSEDDANLGRLVEGEEAWNVILWADHRAEEEAEKINSTGEGVLGFVGKTMSVSGREDG